MTDVVQVSIVNTALSLLGQEPVADLSEPVLETSIAATKLMRQVEEARDTVLRRHGWVCALEYVQLAPAVISGYVNWRYPTVFQLPANALHVWEIGGVVFNGTESCWTPRWQVGTVELEDSARLVIRAANATDQLNVAYVRRASWASLDPQVKEAIAFELAARCAYSINGDQAKADKVAVRAEQKALAAVSGDGTQEGGQPPLAPSKPAMIRAMANGGGGGFWAGWDNWQG